MTPLIQIRHRLRVALLRLHIALLEGDLRDVLYHARTRVPQLRSDIAARQEKLAALEQDQKGAA